MTDKTKTPENTNPVHNVPTKALFREIQAMPVRDIKDKSLRELDGIRKNLIREACEVTRCVQYMDGIIRAQMTKEHRQSKKS